MRLLILILLLSVQKVSAEGPKNAVSSNGNKVWTIQVDQENEERAAVVIYCDDEDFTDEIKRFWSTPGTTFSSPNIAVDGEENLLAAWIETGEGFSRCVGAYFNGDVWEPKKIISYKTLWVDPESSPALCLNSEYDASILFVAHDPLERCSIYLNHLERGSWKKSKAIYTSSHSLQNPTLKMDPFDTNIAAWIDATDGLVQIALSLNGDWAMEFEAPAQNIQAPTISLGDTDQMISWLVDSQTVQSVRHTDTWSLIGPVDAEGDILYMAGNYAEPLGHFLVWCYEDTENLDFAFFNGKEWKIANPSDEGEEIEDWFEE